MDLSSDCGRAEGAPIAQTDWGATPLGPVGDWPQRLRSAVDLILPGDLAMLILWGDAFRQIHNDAIAG